MGPGKAAAQACHAARLSLLHYLHHHPDRITEFRHRNSVGTLIVLDAPLDDLELLAHQASRRDLPWALFSDSPHFDGQPIITALAIGPADRSVIKPLVRHLRCL